MEMTQRLRRDRERKKGGGLRWLLENFTFASVYECMCTVSQVAWSAHVCVRACVEAER